MTLSELASFYLSRKIGLSARYRVALCSIAGRADREIEHPPGQLPPPEAITRWLQAHLDSGRAPASVAHYRRILMLLFRFGYESCGQNEVRLPPVRVPTAIPEAWTIPEIEAILRAISREPGSVGRWPATDWWRAVFLCCYWTGARIGSVIAAVPEDWDSAAAVLLLRKTKNGRACAFRLHRQACEAINRIHDLRAPRLFDWPGSRWTFFRRFRAIVEAAAVPCPRANRFGLFHRVRKTVLTQLWAVDPSMAQRQADHSSAAVTQRHYIDPRIAAQSAISAADVLPVPEG